MRTLANCCFAVACAYSSFAIAGSNGTLVYQGRVVRPDGTVPNTGSLTFTLSVYSPSPSKCLLYSETQIVSMVGSQGMFSLQLGAGSRVDGGSHTFNQVFTNGATLSGLTCASGSSYTAGATDDRSLSVSFNDAGTVVNLSAMAIKSVPFALQAHEVDGWGLNNLVKVSSIGSPSTFTTSEMANVKSVGAAACATNEILKWNGSAWACSADATGGSPADAGYTGSKGIVAFDTDAATSGITVASGIAKLSNTGVSAATYGTASKVASVAVNAQGRVTSASEISISIPASQITQSGAAVGEVLKWNGSGWLPAADATGTSPGDATYAAKGLVQADTDAATSGLNLASGVISVNTGTGANQIVKLDASSKLPAVDGSALTNLSASQISAGTLPVSRGGTGSAAALTNNKVMVSSGGAIVEGVGFGSSNTASTFVTRDASGNFAAGAVTNTSNVLKGATSGALTMTVPATVTSYSLVWPSADGSAGQFLKTDGAGNLSWATSAAPGDATYAAKGIVQFDTDAATSGITVASGVASVNAGTGANQIVKLDASSKLPAVDGSALTNLNANNIASGTLPIARGGTGASTKTAAFDALSPNTTKGDVIVFDGTNNIRLPAGSNGQVLTADSAQASGVKWAAASTGTVTSVTGGTGLTGGTITSVGTLAVDVGTGANQIVQLDGSSKMPAVDGSALTNLSATNIVSGTLPVSRGGTGASSFAANNLVGTNGTGTALQAVTCTQNQIISFDASGNYGCYNLSSLAGGTYFAQNGNSFSAAAVLGTNDNNSLSFETDNTTRMTIAATGNVGIGTATPNYSLDVNGDVNIEGQNLYLGGVLRLSDSFSTSYTNIQPQNGQFAIYKNGTNSSLLIYDSTGTRGFNFSQTGTAASISTTGGSNGNLALQPSAGQVGIGTLTPVAPLDIEATAQPITSTTGQLVVNSTDAQAIDKGGMLSLGGNDGSAQRAFANVAGFKENGTSGNYAGYLAFATRANGSAPAERMRINSSGNVGIGTTNPGALLDVKGEIRMTGVTSGYAGFKSPAVGPSVTWTLPTADGSAGQFLKTDGSGNLSWATSAAPGDATYAAKGIVQFDTDAATSGITVASGVASVNAGTGANQIVKLDGTSKLPAVDGSALTNLNAGNIASGTLPIARGGTGASTKTGAFDALSPNTTKGDVIVFDGTNNIRLPAGSNGQVLTADSAQASGVKWAAGSTGTVTSVTGGTGLTGGTITSVGTLAVDVGTGANQIVQLDASSKLPAVDGSALTDLSATQITSGTLPISRGGTGTVSFAANNLVGTNGTGTALQAVTCTQNQIISFDASGKYGCYNLSAIAGSTYFSQNGNSFGAAAVLGTNDNNVLNIETNNTTRMTISATGNVGIGTTSPTSLLHVAGSMNQTSGTYVNTYTTLTTGSSNSTATVYGNENVTYHSGGGNYTGEVNAQLNQLNHFYSLSPTGTLNLGRGAYNLFKSWGASGNAGTVTTGIGSENAAENSASGALAITNLEGAYNRATQNLATSTVSNAYGTHSEVTSSNGTVSNAYGVYADVNGAGTITNSYGVYIDSLAGTNKWGLYQAGSGDQNYFAGNVGIGTNNPGATLDVKGEIRLTGATSGYAGFKSPAVGPSVTWTLPTADGSSGQVLQTDGAGNLSWASAAAGGITSLNGLSASSQTFAIGTSGTAPAFSSATSTHTLNIPMASTASVTAGLISKTDYDTFNSKLGTSTSFSGDVSGAYNATSVDKIKGTPVSISSLTSGNYLKYNGSAWVNSALSVNASTDITAGTLPVSRGGTGASSFAANNLIGTNGTGTALQAVTCTQNQVISFDASGNYGCYNLSTIAGGTYFAQNGNSFAAAAVLGTNDNNKLSFETNNSTRMTIDTAGNVGVGTMSPSVQFHVKSGAASNTNIRVESTNTGYFTDLSAVNDSSKMIAMGIAGSAIGSSYFGINANDSYIMADSASTPLKIRSTGDLSLGANASGNPNLTIASASGNVGIGTSTPSGTFDVEGGTAAASANGSSITLSAQNGGSGNTNGGDVILSTGNLSGTGADGQVKIYGTMTQNTAIHAAGSFWNLNSGIGTTSTTKGITIAPYVSGTTAASTFYGVVVNSPTVGSGSLTNFIGYAASDSTTRSGYTHGLDLNVTSGTSRFNIYASGSAPSYFAGDVGVGVTAPSTKLHVGGSLMIGDGGETCSVAGNGGMIRYSGTSLQFCNGTSWQTLGSSGSGFANGGNSFAAAAVLGTNDNNKLSFETNNSTRMTISTSGNVGIGTMSPSNKLHVVGDGNAVYIAPATSTYGTAVYMLNAGNGSEFGIEDSAGGSLLNGSSAYASIFGTQSARDFQIGTNNTVRMTIDSSGNVGIGTSTPGQKLEVNGTIKATDIILTSDARAKSHIESLDREDSLRKICSVRPVSFQWKYNGHPDQGVIAQEIRNIFPEFVIENPDGSLSVKYNSIIAPLIGAVQELNSRNENLEKKVADLNSRVKNLEEENKKMKEDIQLILQRLSEKR